MGNRMPFKIIIIYYGYSLYVFGCELMESSDLPWASLQNICPSEIV